MSAIKINFRIQSKFPCVSKEEIIDESGNRYVAFRINAKNGDIDRLTVTDAYGIRNALDELLKEVADLEGYIK